MTDMDNKGVFIFPPPFRRRELGNSRTVFKMRIDYGKQQQPRKGRVSTTFMGIDNDSDPGL
jgi:hypothetical protein